MNTNKHHKNKKQERKKEEKEKRWLNSVICKTKVILSKIKRTN